MKVMRVMHQVASAMHSDHFQQGKRDVSKCDVRAFLDHSAVLN